MQLADSAKYALAAQLSILRSCPDVISRLLKGGESVLLAAKVLVVSRLLHTKLSKISMPPPFLETLRNRLATLRRKLLTRIDRHLRNLEASKETLLESMCAFVLATSSSPTDVVRHFHHLRLEAITECVGGTYASQDSILQALRLYVKTLRDSQTLVPGQLAHALERLKLVSIFKSKDLHSLIALNLDVYERWIGDDIKTFTPYIRHDDLSKAEAERLLTQWAGTAVSKFLDGLRVRIRDVQDHVRLMELRQEVLELWFSQNRRSLGIDSAETLDGLRDVFNNQAASIIKKRVLLLEGVGSVVHGSVKDWRQGKSDATSSLWDSSTTSMDVAHGGKLFCDTVLDRLQGRDGALRRFSTEYTHWLDGILSIELTISSLREYKWKDAIDDVDDNDELLDDKQVLLGEDDPRLLQEELSSALSDAYVRMETFLEPARLLPGPLTVGSEAVFLLRVWRNLRQRLPRSYRNPHLGLSSIPIIESAIIRFSLEAPLESCAKRLENGQKGGHSAARPLWEGLPELPVLPSPWAYRLLLEVVQSMSDLGVDIWSPHLSAELKRYFATELSKLLQGSSSSADTSRETSTARANGSTKSLTNGEKIDIDGQKFGAEREPKDASKENANKDEDTGNEVNGTYLNGDGDHKTEYDRTKARDMKTQRLFDVIYLAHALSIMWSKENEDGLNQIHASLKDELGFETKSLDRLSKNAGEYWKRTKLVFALLSS